LAEAQAIFICVNTPPAPVQRGVMGQPSDLSAFKSVLKSIGEAAGSDSFPMGHRIIVNKSTVPVGTSKMTEEILSKHIDNLDQKFSVVSMPEFLAEGQAIANLLSPDRIAIGTP
jgi:UDPglucose 6-dehydrogenase